MSNDIVTPLEKVLQFVNLAGKAHQSYATTSLTEMTRLTQVEPLTVVSKDLLVYEHTPDIMQTMVNLFAGYYFRAIQAITDIQNIQVARILDRVNPDRNADVFLMGFEGYRAHYEVSQESYQWRLPTQASRVALEAVDHWRDSSSGVSADGSSDAMKALVEATNLAVGKHITVKLKTKGGDKEKEGATVEMPINIRLAVTAIPNPSVEHLLSFKTEETTFTERYHKWRAGQITFIKDLILCQDLINEHKKALMADPTGTYQEILRRAANAKKYGLLSGNPSLASASNLFVISEAVAKAVEQKFNGRLENARVRQQVFENTYAMIIAVVDREWDRVTFYTRGIAQSAQFSIKDIKASNKTKGPDIMDVLKSFNLGNSPSF
jgi:hypothetical protein